MDGIETFRHNTLAPSVDKASLQQAAGRNAYSAGLAMASRTARYAQDAVMANTHRKLVEMAMDPKGVEMFLKIAKENRPGVVGAYARAALASSLEARPEQE